MELAGQRNQTIGQVLRSMIGQALDHAAMRD
jgi:hypothetical protein